MVYLRLHARIPLRLHAGIFLYHGNGLDEGYTLLVQCEPGPVLIEMKAWLVTKGLREGPRDPLEESLPQVDLIYQLLTDECLNREGLADPIELQTELLRNTEVGHSMSSACRGDHTSSQLGISKIHFSHKLFTHSYSL